MIRLWGQAQFSIHSHKLAGYELFLREQQRPGGPWRLPENISGIAPAKMTTLLAQTMATMPASLECVTFNLDQSQFIQTPYLAQLRALKATLPFRLGIELTERHGDESVPVTVADLVAAARGYHDAGLTVCLDDVGTGENLPELVQQLDPYVSEYKYAIQNVRNKLTPPQIEAEIDTWRKRALRLGKAFTLEGLEGPEHLVLIRSFKPDVVQGYYFGTPHVMVQLTDLASGE